jgi:hypothetical protein
MFNLSHGASVSDLVVFFVLSVGLISFALSLRYKTIFKHRFKTRLTDPLEFAVPVPVSEGELVISLSDFRTLYLGEISIIALSDDQIVGTLLMKLRKRIFEPAHLGKGPIPYSVAYKFNNPATKLSFRFDLEPGWKGEWVRRMGCYPEEEDVRIVIREKRWKHEI